MGRREGVFKFGSDGSESAPVGAGADVVEARTDARPRRAAAGADAAVAREEEAVLVAGGDLDDALAAAAEELLDAAGRRRPGQEKGDSTSLQRGCSARARVPGTTLHASRPFREMITRPKISQNEWKTTEI